MKIAIHHREDSFSERWIEVCKEKGVAYKLVNAFDSNIIEQVADCDAFMWHYHHALFEDVISAKKILFALEQSGKKVFPNFNTGWYFDDKVAQTYLLQAVGAPVVPSFIFYNKNDALTWAKTTSYPKVFKLKGGASGSNVRLVRSQQEAQSLIAQAFGKGFKNFDGVNYFKERYRQFKNKRISLFSLIKSSFRLILPTRYSKMSGREVGYIYFQDFIENDGFDTRVIVIGDKAFAMKNIVRENDFRASNSGNFVFDKEEIDENSVKLAFETQAKLQSQCTGFDIVLDKSGNPWIMEMGYGFIADLYKSCPGYWNRRMEWISTEFDPRDWMIESLL